MLIAQLSDVRVRPRGVPYRGVADSNRMLGDAIEHLHRLDRRPDLVLLTGGLVDEGHPDEYAMALELLEQLTIPYLAIPGNHDRREHFRAAFGGSAAHLPKQGPLHYCIDDHPVRFVALDSCPPGQHHGDVDSAGLAWLQATLATDLSKPTLLLMHHPPFVSGIPYLDEYRYVDADPLAAPQTFLGPPACLFHLWDPAQGLVSHTSYIGRYPGSFPFF